MLPKDYSNLFRLSPKEKENETKISSAGAELKAERLNRGLSLEEVAKGTNISIHSLTTLEENDEKNLPAPTFVRGFIILYAKFLNIDPDSILSHQQRQLKNSDAAGGDINAEAIARLNPTASTFSFSALGLPMMLGAGLLLAVLLYWGYISYFSNSSVRTDIVDHASLTADKSEIRIPPADTSHSDYIVPSLFPLSHNLTK